MKSKNGKPSGAGIPDYSGFGKIAPVGGYDEEELEEHFDEKIRLTRDLIEASRTMGSEEARYLVDAYYATQENRKRTDNQVRALGTEPHFLIQWLSEKNRTLEHQIGRALDSYTQAHPMGDWMRGVVGIGPVLSAGLLAHINMAHCPTVGHIWQFAGIAGPVAEPASRYASYRIDFGTEIDPNKPPHIDVADGRDLTPYFPDGPTAHVYRLTVGTSDAPLPFYKDEPIPEKGPEHAEDEVTFELQYKYLGQKPWEKGQKRPFNATLKVICWKIGQSFMKLSNREDCYYGRTYRDRKAYEIANNETGLLAEQAAKALPHFKKTTEAYKWYEKGMLPPAHIDARARRYAVKLFLSHMHGEWHEKFFGRPAPLPYPIAHLQHVHFIPPSVGQTKGSAPAPL